MYLEAEHYVSDWEDEGKILSEAIKASSVHGLGSFEPKNVTYQLAYWRKANAIHNWFVKNVQEGKDECQSSYVPKEKLVELRETCQKVLDNHDLAVDLLPPVRGFFFGSTDLDEWYFQDLERTTIMLDKILANPKLDKLWIQYRASW